MLVELQNLDMKNVNTHYKKGKICQNMRHFKYKDKHYLLVLLLFFQVVVQEFLKKKKKKKWLFKPFRVLRILDYLRILD